MIRERPTDHGGYAYILGMYLGDGCITCRGNAGTLSIYLDTNSMRLSVSSASIRHMFPQHGPGKKHERKIELTDWQQDIVDPRPLLREL